MTGHTINNTMTCLDKWNAMSAEDAACAVLACCGSAVWAAGLAARRPLGTLPELLAASDAEWWSLAETDWKQAFDSHPRIGETHAQSSATDSSLRWSESEQSAAMLSDGEAKQRLAEGNAAYEQRFGRIFIVCAAGKSSAEIFALLQARMRHSPEAELHEAAEQQRQITHIRLRKWLATSQQEHTQ